MSIRELVCIIDPIHPIGMERIALAHDVIGPDNWREDPRLLDTTVIVIRTSPLGHDIFGKMPRLKAIVKHGAGVDNIDISAATDQHVMVANTPGGSNSSAVAEGAVALMLGLLRRTRDMDELVRNDGWNKRWGIRLRDLTGANVGLIGFGRIAQNVAKICSAGFGANVSAYDPMVADEYIQKNGVTPVKLTEVLQQDIVSIHVPLTDQTRNLIDTVELALMKPHALLINCSRGGIVNEEALADALRDHQISGAGIDVFLDEPPAANHPLFALSNCLLSPHMAGVTEAGMKDMAQHVAEVVAVISKGETPSTILNAEVLS